MASSDPEILPPLQKSRGLSDEQVEHLAAVLDDIFQIPGTKIRFGLDPIVGLVPGLGDVITGLLSFLIVFTGWRRGLSKVTVMRMVANIAIDTLLGSIPVFGDVFDTVWKSNRMNYKLLVRDRGGQRAQHVSRDWLFFVLLLLCAVALIVLPIAVVVAVFYFLRTHS
jgi:hypothetical protein